MESKDVYEIILLKIWVEHCCEAEQSCPHDSFLYIVRSAHFFL